MAHSEATLVGKLPAAFHERHPLDFWRKLHGGPLQAGLPDVIVAVGKMSTMGSSATTALAIWTS
jgi:hypothetical protein